jgi:hypothetical protein
MSNAYKLSFFLCFTLTIASLSFAQSLILTCSLENDLYKTLINNGLAVDRCEFIMKTTNLCCTLFYLGFSPCLNDDEKGEDKESAFLGTDSSRMKTVNTTICILDREQG